MGVDSSIAISAKDNFTQAITTMRNANQAFNKDLDGLQTKLDKLNSTKVTLKMETDRTRTELKEAEKQFLKTGSAADSLKLHMASQNYEQANRNLRLVSSNARQAEKDMLSLTSTQSKADNRAGGMGDVVKKLGAAGATQFLGQAVSEVAQTYMTSRLGDAGGTMFGSVLGGAGTGAAIGTAFGPVGTVLGAVGGAVVGAVQGVTKNAEKKDDAFKSYVQDQYQNSMQRQADELSSGITIAGGREQTQMAFAQRFGSDEAATEYLEKVKDMAATTNYTYDEITGYTKKLLNSYDKDSVFGVLMSMSDASAGLNLASSDVDMFINGLSRMRTTGKATMEYLNYFSERGVDVYQALADATGADKSKISDMVTKGKISGDTAAQAILDYINQTFGGLSEKLAGTYDAMVGNLQDAQDNMNAKMGEGYTEEKKKGIEAQTQWLTGDSGERMGEAEKLIGKFKASQENLKEQLAQDAKNSVLYGHLANSYKDSNQAAELQKYVDQYKKAQETLAQLQEKGRGDSPAAQKASNDSGMALAAAQVLAENEYYSTEGAKIVEQGNLNLIGSIQSSGALSGAYENAGYSIGQSLTKGIQSALDHANLTVTPHITISGGGNSGSTVGQVSGYTSGQLNRGGISARTHAAGLPFVPYDNYPALLHYGERVLTANQARQQESLGGGALVSGNTFVIREESDIDKVATAIVQKLMLAKLLKA